MLGLTLNILIVLALIAANGVFAMAETALVASQRIRLQQQADRGNMGARAALSLLKDPTRFFSIVQVGITFVTLATGIYGENSLASRLRTTLEDAGVSHGWAEALSVVAVLLFITYLSVVFGELVPKRIGFQFPERIAGIVALPMQAISRVSGPFVWVLSASASLILRLFGVRNREDAAITEEDIRFQIALSAESGSVAEDEAALLDRVFHFGDRQVHEVMIPRTEAVWLQAEATLHDFYEVYAQAPHSRFPVFAGDTDHVVGVLGIKDVLAALSTGTMTEASEITPLIRPAFFVPETKAVGELFREMQSRGVQMAIAVDEFGGTAGIVTLEQLIEEMVGPVGDELRPGETEIQTIDEHTHEVDGSLSVGEARDELGIDFPEGPYDTIAGFVLNHLGHIPVDGEQLSFDGYRIIVAEMRGPKIERLRVTKV